MVIPGECVLSMAGEMCPSDMCPSEMCPSEMCPSVEDGLSCVRLCRPSAVRLCRLSAVRLCRPSAVRLCWPSACMCSALTLSLSKCSSCNLCSFNLQRQINNDFTVNRNQVMTAYMTACIIGKMNFARYQPPKSILQ